MRHDAGRHAVNDAEPSGGCTIPLHVKMVVLWQGRSLLLLLGGRL